MKIVKIFCTLSLLFIFLQTHAFTSLEKSKQLIIVITDSWSDHGGKLQRFSRKNVNQPWHAVGKSFTVVIGKNGLAWSANAHQTSGPIKKEGDGKSPAGIFKLNNAFGFAKKADKKLQLAYLPLNENTVCVDDVHSRYYGRIIDSRKVSVQDWHSGEMMLQYPQQYQKGIVVDYNREGKMLGGGSCIFLHIKKNEAGTAGCTAMTAAEITTLWHWVKPGAVLVELPKDEYLRLRKSWRLP